ncbi:hypothetical protein CPY51_28150 [Rhizobium tubonense]|uniref:Uncharacterized protein n=1 Tax=Rhizobium tubonense TaxID=484088 RepID=A0A2W4C5A8_9HYPH|nr:hypothetical protein CPY51_28150 [Rhizobium tubonense]
MCAYDVSCEFPIKKVALNAEDIADQNTCLYLACVGPHEAINPPPFHGYGWAENVKLLEASAFIHCTGALLQQENEKSRSDGNRQEN